MIPNRWYPVLEAAALGRKPVGIERLGRKWVLWRDATGKAAALPAACPHRGAALDQGKVVAGEIQCPWHGFRFTADGRCTAMPCEGPEARIPPGMRLEPPAVREAHGLVWLWHGEVAPTRDVPFLPRAADALPGTAEASYVLPYHYTRMVETNFDIHHTPFVHGRYVPVPKRVREFEVTTDGDHIASRGVLAGDDGRRRFEFRAEAVLPCLFWIELGRSFQIAGCATPVDDTHSWMWFRYYQSVTRWPALGTLLSWLMVQGEVRLVQPQDWRVFEHLPPGSIDEVDHHYVQADGAIALYRRRRTTTARARSRGGGRLMASHESADVRRDQILEAALACFGRGGYHAARMDDIVRESGLSKGAIYHHFASKDDIFLALFDRFEAAILAGWDEAGTGSALETIRRDAELALFGILGVREVLDAWPEFFRHAEARGRFARVYSASRGRLTATLERGIEAGEIRRVAAPAIAAAVTALVEGLLLQAVADPAYDAGADWPAAWELFETGLRA